MNKSTIFASAGVLLLIGAGFAAGRWFAQPTIDDLIKRNNQLAKVDSVRVETIQEMSKAYSRTAYYLKTEHDLNGVLADDNAKLRDNVAGLLDNLADKNRQIETLVATNVELRDRLSDTSSAVVTDTSVSFPIHAENVYERGKIGVDGEANVNLKTTPPAAAYSLDFTAQASPNIVVSRAEDGTAECTVDVGDMPLKVSDMTCAVNLDIKTKARKGFPVLTFGGGILLGVAALFALGSVF